MSCIILDKIIKPEYRKHLADWEKYAKPNDISGLHIIDQIYMSKGNKKVNFGLPKEKTMY
jgi:hypothetical protein